MHVLHWGGLPPKLLQGGAHIPELLDEICHAIDHFTEASLSALSHVEKLLSNFEGITSPRAVWFKSQAPHAESSNFQKDVKRVVSCCNIHHHTDTSHKPNLRRKQCRLARPQSLVDYTACTELSISKDPRDKRHYVELDVIRHPDKKCIQSENRYQQPISVLDRQIVMCELKRPLIPPISYEYRAETEDIVIKNNSLDMNSSRTEVLELPKDMLNRLRSLPNDQQLEILRLLPERNGMIVEYNRILAVLLGCNTTVCLPGSDIQTKAILYYLLKYMTK